MKKRQILGLLLLLSSMGFSSQKYEVVEREARFQQISEALGNCYVLANKEKLMASWPESKVVKKEFFSNQMDALKCENPQALMKEYGEIQALQKSATAYPMLASQAPKEIEDPRVWLTEQFPWRLEQNCHLEEVASRELLLDNRVWHHLLITQGYECAAELYWEKTYELDEQKNAFDRYQEQDTSSKNLLKGVSIVYIPHFRWEEYTLKDYVDKHFWNPLMLLISGSLTAEESVTDEQMIHQFRVRGAKVYPVWRTSSENLDEQVNQTLPVIAEAEEAGQPYLVVSRSSGSQLFLAYYLKHGVPKNLSGFINILGTPHGSIIGRDSAYAPAFFRGVVPRIIEGMNGAHKLKKVPTVPNKRVDALQAYIEKASIRENVLLLSSLNPDFDKKTSLDIEEDLPVINVMGVPKEKKSFYVIGERDENNFSLSAQLKYGPSETSTLWTDASVESPRSLRIYLDSDHLTYVVVNKKTGMDIALKAILLGKSLKFW